MDFAERLNVLQAAEGEPALLVMATVDLVHFGLPLEEREAIRRALLAAAVPHWFDPPFLATLLAVDESEAERLHGQLCALTAVEPFSARGHLAVNVHESIRLVLREYLRLSDPKRWRLLAERARAHLVVSTSVFAQIEALHHLFAINQEAAAAECETLDRDLMQNPEWRHALAISLREMAATGWLGGSARVEALLIPLQLRSERGETASLEREVCDVVGLAERYSHSPGLARAQSLMGYVYKSQGRRDKALACFKKSRVIFEQLVQEDPCNTRWQCDLAVAKKLIQDAMAAELVDGARHIAARRRRRPWTAPEERGMRVGTLEVRILRRNVRLNRLLANARLIKISLARYIGSPKKAARARVQLFIRANRPSPPCVFKVTTYHGKVILLIWDGEKLFFSRNAESLLSNLSSSTHLSKNEDLII